MLNKIDDIELLIRSISLDFTAIAITETWETKHNSSLLNLPGFSRISKARAKNQGGGVAFFLKDDTKYRVKDIHTDSFESLFIDIVNPTGKTTLLGVIYRPPDTDLALFHAELEKNITINC